VFSVHAKAFDAAVHAVAEKGFPIVVVDEDLGKKVNVSCVVADNAIGGRLVAERMVSAGHCRLAFIGDLVAETVRERWSGFSKLAAELTGEAPLKYDVKGEDRLGDWGMEVRAAVVRIMKRKVRPTAVFCSCDAIARHAMRAFAEVGMQVPGDVSLVGFDDDPIAEWTTPALTTIRQDFAAMGREAVKALVARIAKPAAPGATVAVPVEFVERESLARRRN
jgi:LacI family transcriptional regulator